MRAPNMFDTAVQTNKKSPIKHENKRNVWSCLIECLMAFKFYQTQPNTIKHDQTAPNKVAKRWNVWSPNNVWRCLVTKHFPFGQAFTSLPGSFCFTGVSESCMIPSLTRSASHLIPGGLSRLTFSFLWAFLTLFWPINNKNYQPEEWKLRKLGWNTSNSTVTTYLRSERPTTMPRGTEMYCQIPVRNSIWHLLVWSAFERYCNEASWAVRL